MNHSSEDVLNLDVLLDSNRNARFNIVGTREVAAESSA